VTSQTAHTKYNLMKIFCVCHCVWMLELFRASGLTMLMHEIFLGLSTAETSLLPGKLSKTKQLQPISYESQFNTFKQCPHV